MPAPKGAAQADQPAAESPPSTPEQGPTPEQLKQLRFTRRHTRYHRNDVAGFPARYADQLIQKGVAVEDRGPLQSAAVDSMVRK